MLDYITMAFVVVLMTAFALPFIIHSRKNTKKKALAKKRLLDFASNNGLSLCTMEFWRNSYFMGLDQVKAQLVYSNDINSNSPQLINLREVREVQVHELSRKIKQNGGTDKVIDRLELILIGDLPEKRWILEVFEGDRFSDVAGEPVLIKTWKDRIQNTLDGLTVRMIAS